MSVLCVQFLENDVAPSAIDPSKAPYEIRET